MSAAEPAWFTRPSLTRTRPDRRAARLYRSAAADGKGKDGTAIGGIPLVSTEAAVVAAVRMAYKVADAQIDRSARLAKRLREAGDQALGPGSERRTLDATERLVFNAFMALLGWVETAAAENGSPLKRLAVAQYRLLGSLLGLGKADEARRSPADPSGRPVARASAPFDELPRRMAVRIQHTGQQRRAVRVRSWKYAGVVAAGTTIPVKFYTVEGRPGRSVDGHVVIGGPRSATLKIDTGAIAGGRWRAALCDADGLQIGRIEIVV